MRLSITTGCCVCSKPVKVEIKEWYAVPKTSIRVFCPDCIGKEPKTIERIMYKGTEVYVRKTELDDNKDYPWQSSLTKVARCGMCKMRVGMGDSCIAGHRIVFPLITGEHNCQDYRYLPDIIIISKPKYPECELCSHWFKGVCSGIEWRSFRTRSICEFYRDARTICVHAVPVLQYGDHHRNNYCTLPPDQRDGDSSRGWKWMCPAHTRYCEHLKCYRAKGEG